VGIDHFETNQTCAEFKTLAQPMITRDAVIVVGLP
jgi:hypothetical protein